MRRKIISETVEAIFDQIGCSFLQKTHCSYLSCSKKLFGPEKIIFGALGRHFFQTLVTFHKLRIFQKLRIKIVESMLSLNTYHYQTAFKTWGLILIFWQLFSKLIYWSGDYKQVQGLFKKWGLNPQFLKTPQKAPWVEFITHFLGGKVIKRGPFFWAVSWCI